jgi:plastocyanin
MFSDFGHSREGAGVLLRNPLLPFTLTPKPFESRMRRTGCNGKRPERVPNTSQKGEVMRRLIYLAALALVVMVAVAPSATAQPTTTTVSIQDFFFSPANVNVAAGTTVTWVNDGNVAHTVTSDDGQFDSGVLMPGDSYTVVFNGRGTITYHCSIHPSMTGSVTVGTSPMGGASGQMMMGNPMWMASM